MASKADLHLTAAPTTRSGATVEQFRSRSGQPDGRGLAAVIPTALFVALLTLISVYALYRPAPDTDLIFYAATVHQWQGKDPAAIHEAAYADAEAFLAPDVYARMTAE